MTTAHKLVIPEACLLQHLVVLGKTGSGKSSTLRHLVEHLLQQGERVCIIDPKGDWYGLPSSADGKGEGFPVILFGNFKADRSDVPMDAHAGKEVAELIGKSKQACVLGFNGWMPEARTQFWIDFASTLFNSNQGKLHLVIDEVHNFAPKGKVLSPQAGKALHWTNRLASEGRGLGIRLLMASQRPQKVHNDTLTSCETLVAMRVIHASDRMAVKEWIDGCGDGTSGKEVLDGLASMKRGQAWVWSPDAMFLEKVTFPMFRTFDSFSENNIVPPKKWATVDIEAVKVKLARVVESAKENDPKELKREIARLQQELAKAQKEKPAPEIKEVCVVDKEAVQELIQEANDWAALSIALMKRLEAVTPGQRTAVERAVLQPVPRPTPAPKTFVHHASGTVTKASPAPTGGGSRPLFLLTTMDKHTCKHFCGLRDKQCSAGIPYASVTPRPNDPGSALRIPCTLPEKFDNRLSENQRTQLKEKGTCEKFELPTQEDIDKYDADVRRIVDMHMKSVPFAAEMRKKHREKGFAGIVECPICKGTLHFRVSSYNGHTSGKCETEGCLNYME